MLCSLFFSCCLIVALRYGNLNALFVAPSMCFARNKRCWFYACYFRPFSSCMRFPTIGNVNICATVVVLSNRICPAAIIGAISHVVVNAVNGQFVLIAVSNGPFSKLQKICSPFLAYVYTSGPVSFEVAICLRITSRFHVAPYAIKPVPIPKPVRFCALRLLFRRKASTRRS